MPILSFPGEPPCTLVLLTGCKRRSLPLPHQTLRSLHLQRESTLSGSVAPSWPPSPPSNRCGSPSRSTTSPALALSTENASKFLGFTILKYWSFLLYIKFVLFPVIRLTNYMSKCYFFI